MLRGRGDITTQGHDLRELQEQIRDAVNCHFEPGEAPRGVTPGSDTVRPSHARYHFHPNFISVVVRDSNKEGIDFKAELTAQPKKR